MTRVLIFTIEAPCDWINSNHRLHPLAKARLTKTWRNAAMTECQRVAPGLQLQTPVHIEARIHKTRSGRWDPNNLAPTTKAIVDGLVDAGLIPDDSWRELEGPDHRRGHPGPNAITLTITHHGANE
ncbi:hypothetical protein [Arthrobacter sp. RCC_34]|uniref:hypothetical protein n=1 Tax=Arthrobacter sp. RCC_34 TaxID=3239230 RepID=UPI003523721A